MREIKILNLEAGESRSLYVAGSGFIYLKSAPSDLKITIDNGETITAPEGAKIRLSSGVDSEVRIENAGIGISDFVLVVGVGDYDEPQAIGTVKIKPLNLTGILITSIALDASAIEAVSASDTRLKLTLKNTGAEVIEIGSNADLAANNYPLAAGEKLEIAVAAGSALFAKSTATGSVLAIIEEFESGGDSGSNVAIIFDESGEPLLDESGNTITAE